MDSRILLSSVRVASLFCCDGEAKTCCCTICYLKEAIGLQLVTVKPVVADEEYLWRWRLNCCYTTDEIVYVKLVTLLAVLGWQLVRLLLTLLRGGAAHVTETSAAAGWNYSRCWNQCCCWLAGAAHVANGWCRGDFWYTWKGQLMVKLVTVGSSAAVQCCCCDVVSRSEQEKQSCYELKKREGVDVAWLLDVTDAENTSTAAHGWQRKKAGVAMCWKTSSCKGEKAFCFSSIGKVTFSVLGDF